MKNILIATDFSEGSKNAIEHARKIAKQLKAKLIYLHAHYPIVPTNYLDPNGIYLSTPETDIQGTLKDLKKALSHFQEEDKKDGISSEIRVELGDLSSCIQTIEEQEKLDLVIISKTSQTNFLDKLIGSTAKGLLHDLHVPLLIIPSNFHADIFEKVLYATQLEFDEIPYIKSALKWSEKGKNKLTIAHLDEEFETDLIPNHQFLEEIKEALKKEEVYYKNADTKSFKPGIIRLIKDENASLICLTTHKRNLLTQIVSPSKTRDAIDYLPIPVLVFNAPN
ncbi:hypothetical protein EOJ36_09050 [Sandaracinomonas limnophila]|uniref:UspA domain-containing protein n=1 Tax=Sandaracinomonas limnophila TaxID=1862386 RepID=A0A437PP63_9BACT|nr:universal stress protein [Sandaracinomonas limnophila]RVU24065.1 hypothetical protein EOJ36_09050 [Sandaracinomonas limnophila]